MARPISRGVLSFGLVSIPVELYSAIEDHNIRFHLLHKECASRVRNQLFCPVCKVVIERDEFSPVTVAKLATTNHKVGE
jgi:DNA end-binding protein Ku